MKYSLTPLLLAPCEQNLNQYKTPNSKRRAPSSKGRQNQRARNKDAPAQLIAPGPIVTLQMQKAAEKKEENVVKNYSQRMDQQAEATIKFNGKKIIVSESTTKILDNLKFSTCLSTS
jgi:hypothetical protein